MKPLSNLVRRVGEALALVVFVVLLMIFEWQHRSDETWLEK